VHVAEPAAAKVPAAQVLQVASPVAVQGVRRVMATPGALILWLLFTV